MSKIFTGNPLTYGLLAAASIFVILGRLSDLRGEGGALSAAVLVVGIILLVVSLIGLTLALRARRRAADASAAADAQPIENESP